MSDSLHNNLPEKLITKQNLIDNNFIINKKFVMIDSRAYTDEAFEYVLSLGDISGAIIFVYNTRKIWANGRYFGGDIFQDDLYYFSQFATEVDGISSGLIQADKPQQLLKIAGKNHLTVEAFKDEDSGQNNLVFDYDLKSAVNTERIDINGEKYNLEVEDGQIKLKQYKPISVTLSSLPILEIDSVDDYAEVSFKLTISGTLTSKPTLKLNIEGAEWGQVNPQLDEDNNIVTARVPKNTQVKFNIYFDDNETSGTVSVTQKWGYRVVLVTTEDIIDNIDSIFNEEPETLWVPGTKLSLTTSTNTSQYESGYFVCLANLDLTFTDTSVNLAGGWTPLYSLNKMEYESPNKIEYTVWKTDHEGLGLIKWKIVGEAE